MSIQLLNRVELSKGGGKTDRCTEKKRDDTDAGTGVGLFAFQTAFYSHIDFMVGLWVSSIYTKGHEA